jgi:hypothetical protein
MSTRKIAMGTGPLVADLCKALGLEHVRRLVLTIDYKEGVSAEIHRFITEDELSRVNAAIERNGAKAQTVIGESD